MELMTLDEAIEHEEEKAEATYQYLEEARGNGMFFYTSCCGNRMYSVESDPMKYHGCLCPKCFWHNKSITLYLRGTPDGIRVFETERVVKTGGINGVFVSTDHLSDYRQVHGRK